MAFKSHNLSRRKGFTLAEFLIYIGIFSVVSTILYGILTDVMDANSRETSANEITSQLNTVLSTVQTYVKGSSQIEVYQDVNHLASATTSGSYLMVRTLATSTDPTCIYLSNGTVKLAIGPDSLHKSECTGQAADLTTSKIVANSLTFMVAQQAGGHAFVQVDAQLSNNTADPKLVVSKAIKSVIGRVSAATFDS
ncbi:MAG: prepilin-type N-terminal cleavage/methylation domain-containing protein, partial [Patescibacteria group bacterium]|nr:prepilin-type N-terminal cleavage/methylation domain-containing protein [Patescibacteria group bacterium]